ncbi:hypothetical protein E4T49_08242 [Aureobasidium sp. EXF-10728]|nr:hypothetical protein E4T49_08242 [Aureobasidium sp. EXF-10728]
MPSSTPLNPKATVFTPSAPTLSAPKLNPEAATFIPARKPKHVERLIQELQASLAQMATSHPAYHGYELIETSPIATTGLFSLPLELRLNIYNLVLDEDFEIYETGLPALLRTRLQITKEIYQLCKLRIVLVSERSTGNIIYKFSKDCKSRWPSTRSSRRKFQSHRVWRHWQRILCFGKSVPRADLFVDIKVETWCAHAAGYPQRVLRSHGRCRGCRVRRLGGLVAWLYRHVDVLIFVLIWSLMVGGAGCLVLLHLLLKVPFRE